MFNVNKKNYYILILYDKKKLSLKIKNYLIKKKSQKKKIKVIFIKKLNYRKTIFILM